MKKTLSLAFIAAATCISISLTACGDSPEKNYEKAQEYIFEKKDWETGKKYLEKAAKGGHKKAQEQLIAFQDLSDEVNRAKKMGMEENSQPKNTEEKKELVKSNVSVDDQLKDLRKVEVALKNRAEKIIAAQYDSKHTFGEHTQAMRKAMNTISSLFQQSLSTTDEKTKAKIVAHIQQQCVIAEQNAKWIEDNAPLRQAIVTFENDFIKRPLSVFLYAELRLLKDKSAREKFSAIVKDINNTGVQIDNLLETTDFNEAKVACQKSIPNISESYAKIGVIALECSDIYVYNICQSVLTKLNQEQSAKLEQVLSDRITKLKQQIEQQIEKKDWSNAEKTMTDLSSMKVDTMSYQQKIAQGKENN